MMGEHWENYTFVENVNINVSKVIKCLILIRELDERKRIN